MDVDANRIAAEEQRARRAELEAEIARVQEVIAAKQSHGADAERFFKK